MGTAEHSWTATDREHERQGERDEDFKKHLAKQTTRHAAAIRTNCLTGHQQTLASISESLAHCLSGDGVTENLIRASLSCGRLAAGQILLDMIGNCIDADAENAALVEMDRAERAGGLDVVAMRAAAPQEVRVPA